MRTARAQRCAGEWPLSHQRKGTWDAPYYAECGFPGYGIGERMHLEKDTAKLAQSRELAGGFMLKHNLYRRHFPFNPWGAAADTSKHRQVST